MLLAEFSGPFVLHFLGRARAAQVYKRIRQVGDGLPVAIEHIQLHDVHKGQKRRQIFLACIIVKHKTIASRLSLFEGLNHARRRLDVLQNFQHAQRAGQKPDRPRLNNRLFGCRNVNRRGVLLEGEIRSTAQSVANLFMNKFLNVLQHVFSVCAFAGVYGRGDFSACSDTRQDRAGTAPVHPARNAACALRCSYFNSSIIRLSSCAMRESS